jgi:hypothetical protein
MGRALSTSATCSPHFGEELTVRTDRASSFYCFEMGSCCVIQLGLKLLGSSNPSTLTSLVIRRNTIARPPFFNNHLSWVQWPTPVIPSYGKIAILGQLEGGGVVVRPHLNRKKAGHGDTCLSSQ